MLESVSERFRTILSNSSKQRSTFSQRNLTVRYVNHLLLFTVVPSLMSFRVRSYQCFFSRANFEISNFDHKYLHQDEIFEKEGILHFLSEKSKECEYVKSSHTG